MGTRRPTHQINASDSDDYNSLLPVSEEYSDCVGTDEAMGKKGPTYRKGYAGRGGRSGFCLEDMSIVSSDLAIYLMVMKSLSSMNPNDFDYLFRYQAVTNIIIPSPETKTKTSTTILKPSPSPTP